MHLIYTNLETKEPNLRKIIDDENPSSKILGIIWNEKDDTLSFNFQEICDLAQQLKPTKRNILKILSMFYDPTGILQPVIINLKIIFQNICKQKILWDDELPIDIANDWANIINSLNDIQEIKIPRKIIFQDNVIKSIELHGFSDASFQGYGVCIYLRTLYESGDISVNLVSGKSRVARLKETTITRMELLGNLILSRLMNTVYNALRN